MVLATRGKGKKVVSSQCDWGKHSYCIPRGRCESEGFFGCCKHLYVFVYGLVYLRSKGGGGVA